MPEPTPIVAPALNSFQTVYYGNHALSYFLTFRERRSLRFQVQPNGGVHVVAPLGTAPEWVAERVLRKAPWILKHQARFQALRPLTPPRRYLSGETHLYLGRQYRLLLVDAPQATVKLLRGRLVVAAPAPHTPERTATQLAVWYRQRAAEQFQSALNRVWPRFAEFNLHSPTLLVRRMPTRWGSCSAATGHIRLNVDLVRADRRCIDYVVLHECCHLVVPDHSQRFYQLQARLLPDWAKWKERLAQQLK